MTKDKSNKSKTDGNVAVKSSRLVSAGFEVMHKTGEYNWEQASGPYKTAEEAEAVMLEWFEKKKIPHMTVVQFFHTNDTA